MAEPLLLTASPRDKIWGTTETSPWFPPSGRKIGEVWFLREPEPLPLLVKFVFTSEKLSVQVHPGDAYAQAHENSPGKTEMWHVVRAGPDAAIAVGLKREVSREFLRATSLSGEIERLLNWVPVQPGDTIFTPPGTIHAIGPGVVLCEIQQQSDITYRLYDYGRARELHLRKALDVATPGPHPGKSFASPLAEGEWRLAACPYFVTDLIELNAARPYTPDGGLLQILIVIEGSGKLGPNTFCTGQAWLVPPGADRFLIQPESKARFLRTYVPSQ